MCDALHSGLWLPPVALRKKHRQQKKNGWPHIHALVRWWAVAWCDLELTAGTAVRYNCYALLILGDEI